MMQTYDDHAQILADPKATADELRSIIDDLRTRLCRISAVCVLSSHDLGSSPIAAIFRSIGRSADDVLPPTP
jgi:hypothetical protein